MASRQELHQLAREGRLDILKETLAKEDLDSKCPLGWTLLTCACMMGHAEVVEYLLKAGADPNLAGDGWVPLHEAASRGFEKIVRLLVEFGAEVDVRNDGMSPLHVACVRGFREVVEVLVEMGADVNAQDELGLTGLHQAAARGSCDIARLLVENGADVSVEDDVGWTALDSAIDWGYADIVDVLLHAGSDPNSVVVPLHHAVNGGALSVVRVLLKHGANITASVGDGWTALHEACRRGHLEVVSTLLSSGARPNDAADDGWTALHEACRKNRPDIVAVLLQSGADPNVATSLKWTPLHEACASGKKRTVRVLLEFGASPTACDRRRCTPLYTADESSIVTLLLDYGADSDVSRCPHGDNSQFKCCYEQSRLKLPHLISAYEEHFIKIEAAGFHFLDDTRAQDPPSSQDWLVPIRERFRLECKQELAEMKQKQIYGCSARYADVLYQRLFTLRQIVHLSMKECKASFPIYSSLIRSRFVLGKRKLLLVDLSSGFFSLTSLPRLPPECVEMILTFLGERDLQNVVIACENTI